MRIKATAMGLAAEDHFSDKTLDDTDIKSSTRAVCIPEDFGKHTAKRCKVGKKTGTWYKNYRSFG